MAWQEGLVALTLSFEGFQFRGDIHGAVTAVTDIKRYHTDGVAGNQKLVFLLVIKGEGEDTTEVFKKRAYP